MKLFFIFLISLSTLSFAKTQITWLGQAATLIKTEDNKLILIDPFIYNNPTTPEAFKKDDLYKNIDLLLITHGHGDHMGEYKKILKLSPNAKIIMNADMASMLIGEKQIQKERYLPLNKSGSVSPLGKSVKVTMVRAEHSSGVTLGGKVHYGGEPVGYILTFADGKKLYHAGDTGLFQDMEFIGSYFKPDLAMLPIGGSYTMGPTEAAYAIEKMIKPKMTIPVHYGTFPILSGSPEELLKALKKSTREKVKVLKPGLFYLL